MKMIVITAMATRRCRVLVPIMKGWRVCVGRTDFPD